MGALKNDFEKIKFASERGCKEFLEFLNEEYVPQGQKLNLAPTMLQENSLKRTMVKMFAPIFYPDESLEKKTYFLYEEINQRINNYVEQFKNNID